MPRLGLSKSHRHPSSIRRVTAQVRECQRHAPALCVVINTVLKRLPEQLISLRRQVFIVLPFLKYVSTSCCQVSKSRAFKDKVIPEPDFRIAGVLLGEPMGAQRWVPPLIIPTNRDCTSTKSHCTSTASASRATDLPCSRQTVTCYSHIPVLSFPGP